MFLSSLKSLSQKKLIPQLRSLTQIKQKSLFGTERSLLRIRTKSKQQPMMCKPLCHPMTSRKITEGGRVGGKKNKTVQYKISGVRLRWKMTWNETQNSWSLILEGVCCVWIALGKQTSRLTEITALILCARVIKALGSRLKSFTLQLTGFVLDCSSSTPWLHFVYSRLVCLRPIEIFKLYVYLHCLLTICVSGQEEPPRRMFYGSGKMNHDIQSEILSRNLSSFWKLRTHSQHLKMDVHNWCSIYISMFFDIDNLL